MAATKYLVQVAGVHYEQTGITTSAGSGDSGKVAALDASGKLDNSFMPVGVGADTKSIVTSENLAAGDLVNVYNAAGTVTARKADGSAASAGKPCHGFVLAGSSSGGNAVVYFSGINNQLSGMVAGPAYVSDGTAGLATATVPTTSGHFVQLVGEFISATELQFNPQTPIVLA
jgi:hypothetical protein